MFMQVLGAVALWLSWKTSSGADPGIPAMWAPQSVAGGLDQDGSLFCVRVGGRVLCYIDCL